MISATAKIEVKFEHGNVVRASSQKSNYRAVVKDRSSMVRLFAAGLDNQEVELPEEMANLDSEAKAAIAIILFEEENS